MNKSLIDAKMAADVLRRLADNIEKNQDAIKVTQMGHVVQLGVNILTIQWIES